MIEFDCVKCGKNLRVNDNVAGKQGKCPKCGTTLRVPELAQNEPVLGKEELVVAQSPPPPPVPPTPPPPRLERGHAPHAPSINVHLPKRISSLGVASLILGVVGFLLCWIPLIGILTIPISGLGLVLGGIGLIVALVRSGSGIGYPIAGVGVCGLAFIIGASQVAMLGAAVGAAGEAGRELTSTNQEIVNSSNSPSSESPTPDKPPQKSLDPEQIAGETADDASAAEEWASARNPVRQGDIQVQVVKAMIGKVPLKGGFRDTEGSSEDELLTVEIELENLSQAKKIQYRTWNGADFSFQRDYAVLEDNFGNSYKRINFGIGTDVIGRVESDSLYPGKSLKDILVFEIPVESAEYLNLELPASSFGGEGMLRLRIPADMIQHR